jgi:hypothetical protein
MRFASLKNSLPSGEVVADPGNTYGANRPAQTNDTHS